MRSSSLMVSGGKKRRTLPNVPQDNTITPAVWQPTHSFMVSSGSGSSVPGLTNSIAIIAPRPRTSPMRSSSTCRLPEPVLHQDLDLAGPFHQTVGLDRFDSGQRRRARDRIAAVGAAEPADMRGVHDLGAAGDRRQRQTVGDALGGTDQIRFDAFVLAGEHRPVRANPVCTSSAMNTTVLPAPVQQCGRKPSAGTMKAALTLDGFDDHRGQVVRHSAFDDLDRPPGRQLAVGGQLLPYSASRNGYDNGAR